ncbi:hypothetical protein PAXRUDRAFT_134629, partial [Paxillus rubicundulus Ve08.2h10]
YSHNLVALWKQLSSSEVQSIRFIVWDADHYAAYIYQKAAHLLHNDSLNHHPAPDVLPVFTWFLEGLDCPISQSIKEGAMAMQREGSGSCGRAVYNYIESLAHGNIPDWECHLSPLFCQKSLHKLIVYHHLTKHQMVGRKSFENYYLLTFHARYKLLGHCSGI